VRPVTSLAIADRTFQENCLDAIENLEYDHPAFPMNKERSE
jgi:hypothetical protein